MMGLVRLPRGSYFLLVLINQSLHVEFIKRKCEMNVASRDCTCPFRAQCDWANCLNAPARSSDSRLQTNTLVYIPSIAYPSKGSRDQTGSSRFCHSTHFLLPQDPSQGDFEEPLWRHHLPSFAFTRNRGTHTSSPLLPPGPLPLPSLDCRKNRKERFIVHACLAFSPQNSIKGIMVEQLSCCYLGPTEKTIINPLTPSRLFQVPHHQAARPPRVSRRHFTNQH